MPAMPARFRARTDAIRQHAAAAGLGRNIDLARAAGLHFTTTSRVLRGRQHPSDTFVVGIVTALRARGQNVTTEDLFDLVMPEREPEAAA